MLKKLVLGVWCLVLVFEYRVWVRLGTEGIYLLRNTQYMYVGIYIYTGWWFGTVCSIYWECHHPN